MLILKHHAGEGINICVMLPLNCKLTPVVGHGVVNTKGTSALTKADDKLFINREFLCIKQ